MICYQDGNWFIRTGSTPGRICVVRASELDDDEVKLCNCAACGELLLGESMRPYLRRNSFRRLPFGYSDCKLPAGRFRGRPYCDACFHSAAVTYSRGQVTDVVVGNVRWTRNDD